MSRSKSENGGVVRKAENPTVVGAALKETGWKPKVSESAEQHP
jgi:hypothetical protein